MTYKSKFGFGCMRLPQTNPEDPTAIDQELFNEMVDKTFRDADLNKNNYIEKNELSTLLKSIYVTVGLPPPSKFTFCKIPIIFILKSLIPRSPNII